MVTAVFWLPELAVNSFYTLVLTVLPLCTLVHRGLRGVGVIILTPVKSGRGALDLDEQTLEC